MQLATESFVFQIASFAWVQDFPFIVIRKEARNRQFEKG